MQLIDLTASPATAATCGTQDVNFASETTREKQTYNPRCPLILCIINGLEEAEERGRRERKKIEREKTTKEKNSIQFHVKCSQVHLPQCDTDNCERREREAEASETGILVQHPAERSE